MAVTQYSYNHDLPLLPSSQGQMLRCISQRAPYRGSMKEMDATVDLFLPPCAMHHARSIRTHNS